MGAVRRRAGGEEEAVTSSRWDDGIELGGRSAKDLRDVLLDGNQLLIDQHILNGVFRIGHLELIDCAVTREFGCNPKFAIVAEYHAVLTMSSQVSRPLSMSIGRHVVDVLACG